MDDKKIECEHPQDKEVIRTEIKVWCTACGIDLKHHVTSEMASTDKNISVS